MTEQDRLMNNHLYKLMARLESKVSSLKAYYVESMPEPYPSDFQQLCGLTFDEFCFSLREFRISGKEFVVYLSDKNMVYFTEYGAKFRLI